MIATLDAQVPKDVRVLSGPSQHLFFEHRRKLGMDYYWVVNDTERERVNEIHFAAQGIPERWNALTGAREPLFYTNNSSGTDVRLNLGPWDGFYVVFHPLTGPSQSAILEATNAEQLDHVRHQGSTLSIHLMTPSSASATYVELRDANQVYHGSPTRQRSAATHAGRRMAISSPARSNLCPLRQGGEASLPGGESRLGRGHTSTIPTGRTFG